MSGRRRSELFSGRQAFTHDRHMPSIFGHAAVALSLGSALRPSALPPRFWISLAVAAAIPDLDAIGRAFGDLAIEDAWGGHRGLTHSIPFAMAVAALLVRPPFLVSGWVGSRTRLWLCATVAVASHGILDTFTSYGEGVTLFAPFSWHQVKSAWTPIGADEACRGAVECAVRGIGNELLWLGLPSLALLGLVSAMRRRGAPHR